jgi:predicted dehydrogenase
LTFVCGTQLAGHQRVTIGGTKGRVEVQIPFNAPPDRPTRIILDSGADLFGGGARVEEFPICDQYMLQGDAFSQAVRGAATLPYGVDDAILNMRVVDALFRSAQSGNREKP